MNMTTLHKNKKLQINVAGVSWRQLMMLCGLFVVPARGQWLLSPVPNH